MTQPDECPNAKMLLDAYLIAMTNHGEVVRTSENGPNGFEVVVSKERLAFARKEYWNHVEAHLCRLERKD